MKRTHKIPEEDIEAINESFKTGESETLAKNATGNLIDAKKKVVNDKTITFQDFSGRVLRHQKSIISRSGVHQIIGVKGNKYDDISLDNRNLVTWFESDFE